MGVSQMIGSLWYIVLRVCDLKYKILWNLDFINLGKMNVLSAKNSTISMISTDKKLAIICMQYVENDVPSVVEIRKIIEDKSLVYGHETAEDFIKLSGSIAAL